MELPTDKQTQEGIAKLSYGSGMQANSPTPAEEPAKRLHMLDGARCLEAEANDQDIK